MPRIRALRDNEPVSEVNDGEMLDVECTVDRVYPVDNLNFQLISDDTVVSSRQSGISNEGSDGTFSVTNVFSNQRYFRSYSLTEDGVACQVYHRRGNKQSGRLQVIVRCEFLHTLVVMVDIIEDCFDLYTFDSL